MKRILNRTLNPSYQNTLRLLAEFSSDWKENIKGQLDDELSDALDSIVSNRNNIVHGGSSDLTLGNLKSYFVKAQKVVSLIHEECNSQ